MTGWICKLQFCSPRSSNPKKLLARQIREPRKIQEIQMSKMNQKTYSWSVYPLLTRLVPATDQPAIRQRGFCGRMDQALTRRCARQARRADWWQSPPAPAPAWADPLTQGSPRAQGVMFPRHGGEVGGFRFGGNVALQFAEKRARVRKSFARFFRGGFQPRGQIWLNRHNAAASNLGIGGGDLNVAASKFHVSPVEAHNFCRAQAGEGLGGDIVRWR